MAETYYEDDTITLYHGDAATVLATMPDGSVDCIVTSPPYFGLRDYGVAGQIGAESSPAEYVASMVAVFDQLRRVLSDDGTCWLNIGDSYSGNGTAAWSESSLWTSTLGRRADGTQSLTTAGRERAVRRQKVENPRTLAPDRPTKNLLGVPWRLAFALQDTGWILRNAIIWNKPNAMPESVTDRLSTRYEHLFLLTKSRRYWFDLDPIREAFTVEDPAEWGTVRGTTKRRSRDTGTVYGKRPPRLGDNPQSLEFGGAHNDAHPKGRNPGDVWTIPTVPFPGAHFAAFPPEIPRRCISAGCKPGGTVLDPFHGSGTTGMVAQKLGRKYIGIDLNAEYLDLSLRTRLKDAALPMDDAS